MGCNQSVIGPDRPCLILQGHGEDSVPVPTVGKTLLMTRIRPTPERPIYALEVYIAGEDKPCRVFGDKGECERERERFLEQWNHYRPSFTQVSKDPVKFLWLQGECHQGGMWIPFRGQKLLHVFWDGTGTLSVYLEGRKRPYRLENLPVREHSFFTREAQRFHRIWHALKSRTSEVVVSSRPDDNQVWFQGYYRGSWVPRGPSLEIKLISEGEEEPRVAISWGTSRRPQVFRMDSIEYAAMEADRFMKELHPT